MPSREEMISFLSKQNSPESSAKTPTREEMISFLTQQQESKIENPSESEDGGIANAAKSAGSYALDKVVQAGRFIDRYTGAPVRAAIGDAQTTDDIRTPFMVAAKQFGEDPERAPTGKQIAQKMGIPDTSLSEKIPSMFTSDDKEAEQWLKFKRGGPADITASGAVGFGYDIAADPINFIPGAAISKGVESGARGAQAVSKGVKAVSSPILEKAGSILTKVTAVGGKALTGVPEKNIIKYIENTDEINRIISKHGGDMSLAADELRESLQASIQKKVTDLNSNVKKAIETAPAGSTLSNESIVQAMEKVKSGINPELYPESIKEINELIEKIKRISTGEGSSQVGAKAANDAKRFLQDMGEGAYLKDGQIFRSSKDAAKASKAGAREARKAEMALAPDTIAPNKELARLHRYQENVNKNLIAPGKTESALMAAGSGENSRNVKNLRDISESTGFDALGEAEKLSAAKTFASPGWIPTDATGKSAARMATGAFLGSFAGPKGTALGIALTSPQSLKLAINSGNISKKFVAKLAGVTGEVSDAVIQKAVEIAKTKEGQALIRSLGQTREFNIGKMNAVAEEKNKGPDKWARDGEEKLRSQGLDQATIDKIKKSKNGKSILIRASDLKPNSKAMNALLESIRTGEVQGGE